MGQYMIGGTNLDVLLSGLLDCGDVCRSRVCELGTRPDEARAAIQSSQADAERVAAAAAAPEQRLRSTADARPSRRRSFQRHEVSHDRSIPRRAVADGSGNSRRSHHLLFRRDRRRRVEVHRWRHDWSPVFDKEGTSAIGSLAVAASNHNVVYVGTGEACIRGNISHGDGVYKTLDGGKTWKNVGLRDSRAIGKVIVNPSESGHRFRGGAGPSLRAEHRARDFSHHRRRQDLGEGSLQGREHRRHRRCLRSAQSQYSFRRAVAGAAHAVEHVERRSGQRTLPLERRRHHLEATSRSTACPKGRTGSIGVAVAANSDRVYALIEAHNRTADFTAPTMAANLATGEPRPQPSGSGPGTTCT